MFLERMLYYGYSVQKIKLFLYCVQTKYVDVLFFYLLLHMIQLMMGLTVTISFFYFF